MLLIDCLLCTIFITSANNGVQDNTFILDDKLFFEGIEFVVITCNFGIFYILIRVPRKYTVCSNSSHTFCSFIHNDIRCFTKRSCGIYHIIYKDYISSSTSPINIISATSLVSFFLIANYYFGS